MNNMEKIESGLIVDLSRSNKYAVETMIENSEFYGYELENGVYLFPSPVSEYDMLEKALVDEFNHYKISNYTFEGV